MRYEVRHAYSSRRDGQMFGPWQAGDVVELAEGDAEWIERDSPGALAEVPVRQARPEADRQHKGGRNRGA